MADVKLIRERLAANLSTITGIQVSAYALSSPVPPGLQIVPGPVDFDATMRRGADWREFIVQAYVDFSQDVGSQIALDELMAPSGPRSIKAATESDRTLGGLVDDLQVTRAGGYRLVDRPGGAQMVFVEFTVRVLTSN